MEKSNKDFGQEGEEIAAKLLKSKGYKIIARNYRYGKGEIDIIVEDPVTKETVFVEVKSRQNLEFGEPEYAITKGKIKQIKKIAELYLFDKDIDEIECRFDVITILFKSKIKPVIEHFINAFD